jgi:glycerol-3-phosphate dehydrogenase
MRRGLAVVAIVAGIAAGAVYLVNASGLYLTLGLNDPIRFSVLSSFSIGGAGNLGSVTRGITEGAASITSGLGR